MLRDWRQSWAVATRRHHRSDSVRVERLVVVVVLVVLFLVRTMRAGRVVGAVRVGVDVWVWAVCAGVSGSSLEATGLEGVSYRTVLSSRTRSSIDRRSCSSSKAFCRLVI